MSKLDQLRALREAKAVTVTKKNWLPYTDVVTVTRKDALDAERRRKDAERQRKSRESRRGKINLDLAAAEIARATDG